MGNDGRWCSTPWRRCFLVALLLLYGYSISIRLRNSQLENPTFSLESTSTQLHRVDTVSMSVLRSYLKTLKGNEAYRYGDCVLNLSPKVVQALEHAQYEGSILHTFLDRSLPETRRGPRNALRLQSQSRSARIELLASIVRDYKLEEHLPPPTAVVVHIRAGDDIAHRGLGSQKIHRKIQRSIDVLIRHAKIDSIVIVTALHYGVAENSSRYASPMPHIYRFSKSNLRRNVKELYDFIKYQRLPVFLRSTEDIDADFAFLCNARYLISSGGGFSELAAQVNRLIKNARITERAVIDFRAAPESELNAW